MTKIITTGEPQAWCTFYQMSKAETGLYQHWSQHVLSASFCLFYSCVKKDTVSDILWEKEWESSPTTFPFYHPKSQAHRSRTLGFQVVGEFTWPDWLVQHNLSWAFYKNALHPTWWESTFYLFSDVNISSISILPTSGNIWFTSSLEILLWELNINSGLCFAAL